MTLEVDQRFLEDIEVVLQGQVVLVDLVWQHQKVMLLPEEVHE